MAQVPRSSSRTVHGRATLLAAAALALLPLCAASTPKPIFSTDLATVDTCIDGYNNAEQNPTSKDIRDLFALTPEQFSKWNPSVSLDCELWLYPLPYCGSTSDRGAPSRRHYYYDHHVEYGNLYYLKLPRAIPNGLGGQRLLS
ncbi:uncharacterized protein J7T54_007388 [Emericellopsis cladophorae]|uniref:LysM domain-containing protein n=1 Tax=Emericellopsis cladophorae TaxID=2686198 RepID=A0A9P9Y0F3_9HYPO|nr:uncharacterized protein J7T54_007388 [Emericellopsis cladophorae]KAI6780908.1 hypothetical protein J7T54_007388 [Emericellopsis cladophorae]